ncbi:MAG TPA: pyridoxal phosphate-dependent aminotransferase [Nitrosomonas europaea]|uniref:pyridoxal phosphate-dependent aminotransferase n=1 Tax=Nitrosomonas europaea TaxID=915 RepID=UPI002493CD89|nr:pyridoxal phosphate-dependent aminotransferase [Nitrosomonas europaea]HRN81977.1 pyridoxal phosphate-dependent aminotransferase [Nitrosomonas europaea]HRO56983.1 pyridoxal phosphate-dependent aminotransferase [Nitrosomonas europaea]HRQ08577.1 pyridoxal phosphate-dependent aminotransferase [Nitrosomonas europaea]HUM73210.1 pyridoxal phosphate-dependent aminotransferase [Nitrosomonas europaea]
MSDDFDREIDRTGTCSTKYDGRQVTFGHPDVMPLWVADMDFAAPAAVTEALAARAVHPVYGYTLFPDSLYEALINWLKLRHGWKVGREWIVLCPGVVPSLSTVILALSEPDESVIVQPPVYYPFFSVIKKTGRKLLTSALQLVEGSYRMDFADLSQQAVSARMLLFCSPHNPVGRVWSRSELERLLDIARQHRLIIVSDEIHADLIYPGNKHHILASLAGSPESIITAVAPSKTFNIPGLNLSALIVPDPAYRAAIRDRLEMMHVSAANPFSVVAFEAAYRAGGEWLEALMTYLADTREMVRQYLAEYLLQISLISSQGTYLLWLDCRRLGMSDDELKHFFIFEAGIGMNPGISFGKEGSGFMRMNIGAPRYRIRQALESIRSALERRRNSIS